MTVTVRLSESSQEFMFAAMDLLTTVIEADEVLVADSIKEAAARMEDVIKRWRGEL